MPRENGYGSESDVHDSSCKHESSTYSSEENSEDMESVSQVGQNRLHPISEGHHYMPLKPQSFKLQQSFQPYQFYTDRDPLLLEAPGQRSPQEAVSYSQSGITANSNLAQMNNIGHCNSTGSNTTTNQSLNSNNSSKSGRVKPEMTNRNLASQNQSQFRLQYEAPDSLKLKINNALNRRRPQNSNCPSPSSPTESAVSEQSGYMSTASSCWQFQLPSTRKTVSLIRNTNGTLSSMHRPHVTKHKGMLFPTNKPEYEFPNSPKHILNPNYDSAPNRQFQQAKANLENKITNTYRPERVDNT